MDFEEKYIESLRRRIHEGIRKVRDSVLEAEELLRYLLSERVEPHEVDDQSETELGEQSRRRS
jgi:predicted DNA-binding protein (UPF0278 family)